jgi:hypothetical protein
MSVSTFYHVATATINTGAKKCENEDHRVEGGLTLPTATYSECWCRFFRDSLLSITTAFTGLRPVDARKTENPPAATPVQRFVSCLLGLVTF